MHTGLGGTLPTPMMHSWKTMPAPYGGEHETAMPRRSSCLHQETDHYSSSSALRTSSNVMGRAPIGTENTGNPEPWGFRRNRGVAVSPRRARSDMAFPRDSDFACARLLAAAIRSSSIVNVVLMVSPDQRAKVMQDVYAS